MRGGSGRGAAAAASPTTPGVSAGAGDGVDQVEGLVRVRRLGDHGDDRGRGRRSPPRRWPGASRAGQGCGGGERPASRSPGRGSGHRGPTAATATAAALAQAEHHGALGLGQEGEEGGRARARARAGAGPGAPGGGRAAAAAVTGARKAPEVVEDVGRRRGPAGERAPSSWRPTSSRPPLMRAEGAELHAVGDLVPAHGHEGHGGGEEQERAGGRHPDGTGAGGIRGPVVSMPRGSTPRAARDHPWNPPNPPGGSPSAQSMPCSTA